MKLPRFRLEQSFSLGDALARLGMPDMFDDEVADFSKMSSSRKKELKVSAVIHKAFIEVGKDNVQFVGEYTNQLSTASCFRQKKTPEFRVFVQNCRILVVMNIRE